MCCLSIPFCLLITTHKIKTHWKKLNAFPSKFKSYCKLFIASLLPSLVDLLLSFLNSTADSAARKSQKNPPTHSLFKLHLSLHSAAADVSLLSKHSHNHILCFAFQLGQFLRFYTTMACRHYIFIMSAPGFWVGKSSYVEHNTDMTEMCWAYYSKWWSWLILILLCGQIQLTKALVGKIVVSINCK